MALSASGFLVCSLAACSLCQISGAEERSRRDAELERGYWTCYLEASESVQAGLRMDEMAVQRCVVVSHEFQRREFDGDFGRLHEWTLANLPARLAALGDLTAREIANPNARSPALEGHTTGATRSD